MDANEEWVRFAVLGQVRAWHGEQEVDVGSPQQRAVLTALLLRRGRPVMLGELLDAVWGQEPPAAAVSVLRTYASRLRKALEPRRDTTGTPRVLVSVGDGYLLRVAEGALDLDVFEQRVAAARRLRAEGEPAAAAGLLHAALALWQGAALGGVPGPLAESEASRLDEQRLAALEIRLDVDVELGRHGEVIAELLALTDRFPLREELCRLLMLALYRAGRQAEALAAYRGTRATLVAELGIEPGAALQDLHDRILAADTSLGAGPSPDRELLPPEPYRPAGPGDGSGRADRGEDPAAPPPPDPAPPALGEPARPAQLPADLPTFVGRCAELDRARALLPEGGGVPASVVISAIGGMAGIGKTTLAVHWAHQVADRFPDGQLYVNLRGFDPTGAVVTPEEAIRSFLDALGVPPTRIPAGLDAQAGAVPQPARAAAGCWCCWTTRGTPSRSGRCCPAPPAAWSLVTSRNQLTGLVAGEGRTR